MSVLDWIRTISPCSSGGLRKAGLDELGGLAGLADGEVAVLEVPRADRAADVDGRGDEREPAEDRVFQWPALQRPMRAARLLLCFRGDIASVPFVQG